MGENFFIEVLMFILSIIQLKISLKQLKETTNIKSEIKESSHIIEDALKSDTYYLSSTDMEKIIVDLKDHIIDAQKIYENGGAENNTLHPLHSHSCAKQFDRLAKHVKYLSENFYKRDIQ